MELVSFNGQSILQQILLRSADHNPIVMVGLSKACTICQYSKLRLWIRITLKAGMHVGTFSISSS
jgi:hypothetical protein